MQNFSSLALKLREEIEVTDERGLFLNMASALDVIVIALVKWLSCSRTSISL